MHLKTGNSVEQAKLRWLEQYSDPAFRFSDGKTVADRRGMVLDATTEEQLAKAIGNGNWTKVWCDDCGDYVKVAAAITDDVTLCRRCVEYALRMFIDAKET